MNTIRGTTRGRGGRRSPSFSSRGRRNPEDSNASAHANSSNSQPLVGSSTPPRPKFNEMKTSRPRPTHFIAIPLNTNRAILSRISAFQNSLLEYSNPRQGTEKNRIRGLDPSIVIDPRRFHLTLGVMALEEPASDMNPPPLVASPPRPTQTVDSALTLLRSLKPALAEIVSEVSADGTIDNTRLDRSTNQRLQLPLRIVLDKIDIMDPVAPPKVKAEGKRGSRSGVVVQGAEPGESEDNGLRGVSDVRRDGRSGIDEIWTKVLYVAPTLAGAEGEKLRRITDLVYQTFKRAGYLTDTRPLKLHCTVLNASQRRPSRLRGGPFSYSDVLKSGLTDLLLPTAGAINTPLKTTATPQFQPETATTSKSNSNAKRGVVPPLPVLIDLGEEVSVQEIGLWIMGSRGPNNEYVSCGGVSLG